VDREDHAKVLSYQAEKNPAIRTEEMGQMARVRATTFILLGTNSSQGRRIEHGKEKEEAKITG
jgi:hypothetical protein